MPGVREKHLGEIIREVLKQHGLEEKVTETRISQSWEKVMGKPIAAYTNKISLKKRCLIVYLSSSVLRNELTFAKQKIMQMINEELKQQIVNDIVFR